MSEHNPMHVLNREHEIICRLETTVKSLHGLWESDENVYRESVSNVLRFLKEYSDSYHHFKEEEILFPAISNHPDFNLDAVLDELLDHHETFREYAADINLAVNDGRWNEAQQILEKYFGQLLDHIAIENDELFIMAENLFSEKEQEELYFRFADVDRDLGETRKKDLELFPEQIAAQLI